MDGKIFILDGIYITITSMAIVFTILLLIALAVSSFKFIFKNTKKDLKSEEMALTDEEENEDKVVVALAASIMAGDGKINPNFHIKSIKRIK